MDPITETIIWGVVWFFAGSLGSVLGYFIWIGIGFAIAVATNTEWPVAISVILGWITAVIWEIFVFIQVAIHIVTLVQLMAAGG